MSPQLRWQTCTICGTHFQGTPRNYGLNVYCSKPCANVGKSASMRSSAVMAFQLSPLNRETTLRWLACLAAETHRPGETFTGVRTWKGHDAPMPTCDTCAVPFPDLSAGFRLAGSAAA